MPNNIYIGDIQVNDSTVNALISSVSVEKQFNNYQKSSYKRKKSYIFPLSGGTENYQFELVLWVRGDYWEQLVDKEKLIYDEINDLSLNGVPIELATDETPVYLNYYIVQLWFNRNSLIHRATDGKSFISLKFEAQVEKGIDDDELEAGITSFEVGLESLAED